MSAFTVREGLLLSHDALLDSVELNTELREPIGHKRKGICKLNLILAVAILSHLSIQHFDDVSSVIKVIFWSAFSNHLRKSIIAEAAC